MLTDPPWMTRLRSKSPLTLEPVLAEPALNRVGDLVGAGAVDWAVEHAYEFSLHVLQEIPELDGTGGRSRMVRMGAESAILQVLALLVDSRANFVMPDEQEQVVRDCVHRKVPLTQLWAAIRSTHAWITKIFMDACIELAPPSRQVSELRQISTITLQVFDRLTARAGEEYLAESERWFAGDLAIREELIQALLRDADVDIERASKRLGYPLDRRYHLGVVVWHDREVMDSRTLADTATSWLRAAGAQDVLVLNRAASAVWAWGAAGSATPVSAEILTDPDQCVRIGHGNWHNGIDGFRRAHLEAQAVEHVVTLCPRLDRPVTSFDAVDLLAVLLENPERAADFASRELGSLYGSDARSRELRDTIRLYLELNSPKAVADRMFLARGTVVYRLRQAEQALDRSLADRRLQLWTALLLADAIPTMTASQLSGRR